MADRVCVSTVTWARDERELQRLETSLRRLAESGLTVVVADRGSGPAFSEFLASHRQFRVAPPLGPSLFGQVQASLAAAAATGADFILYTEPDKELFFSDGLADFLRRADLSPGAGAVLAARSESSFATFPDLQRFTERTINELCAQFIGAPGDYSYGPFLLNREIVPRVARIAPETGWGWRHFAFATARRLGFSVNHVVGEYPCPPDQQVEGEAERVHRVRQLKQNIDGLMQAITQRGGASHGGRPAPTADRAEQGGSTRAIET